MTRSIAPVLRFVAFLLLLPLSPRLALALIDPKKELTMPKAKLPKLPNYLTARALEVVKKFEGRSSEPAFYVQFQALPGSDRAALRRFYGTSADWKIFRQVCAFHRVAGALANAHTRLLREAATEPLLFLV